jgi:hypothetical protein
MCFIELRFHNMFCCIFIRALDLGWLLQSSSVVDTWIFLVVWNEKSVISLLKLASL